MKTKKIALGLYIVASFMAVLGTVIDNELMMLLSKPAVIPAIFFYYWSARKQKPVNPWLVAVLALNFIGDTIVLLEIEDTKIIMIPYFFSYLIIYKFALADLRRLRFDISGLLLAVFIFSFLMYIMYQLIELFKDTNSELVIPVLIYGAMLGSLAGVSAYCYYIRNSIASFYLAIAILISIVSDVFYIMFSLIFHFPSFSYFEFAVQMISYFFIVKYFIFTKDRSRKKRLGAS